VLFIILVLLQVLFVVSSLTLGVHYLLKILENVQGIAGPLEEANYDAQKIEQGEAFTPDYAAIYNSYQALLKNAFSFLLWMSAIFLALNGSMWLLSHWMLQEAKEWRVKRKEGAQFLLKAWISALVLLGSFMVVSYFVLLYFIRISPSFNNIIGVLKALLGVFVIIHYFFVVALAVAPFSPWKLISTWMHTSVRNFRKTAPLYLIVAAALLASFVALYQAIQYGQSVILLLALGLLSIVLVTVSRIFWIAGIQEIQQEIKR